MRDQSDLLQTVGRPPPTEKEATTAMPRAKALGVLVL
jgi:hypothetical protein